MGNRKSFPVQNEGINLYWDSQNHETFQLFKSEGKELKFFEWINKSGFNTRCSLLFEFY